MRDSRSEDDRSAKRENTIYAPSSVDNAGANYHARDIINAPIVHQTIVSSNEVRYPAERQDDKLLKWVASEVTDLLGPKLIRIAMFAFGGAGISTLVAHFFTSSIHLDQPFKVPILVILSVIFVLLAIAAREILKANRAFECPHCHLAFGLHEVGSPETREITTYDSVIRLTDRSLECVRCGQLVPRRETQKLSAPS